MFYTLLKFLGWGMLLAIIGGCIGWALRALKGRGEVAQANSSMVDTDELDRMRRRLANLEQVVAERDRLRIQLADVRHADSPGIVGAEVPARPASELKFEHETEPQHTHDAEAEPSPHADVPMETPDGAGGGSAGLAAVPLGVSSNDSSEAIGDADEQSPRDESAEVIALDLGAAAAELGKKIKLDDLTVVDGIGPKISELCSGIGVTTWRQLADSDIDDLQSMLDAAGSRYTVHKPGTWPRQAELLATGQWARFREFTDDLDAGR